MSDQDQDQALTVQASMPPSIQSADDEISLTLDPERFNQMQRVATVMARGSLLPDHLVVRPFWAPNSKGVVPPQLYKQARAEHGEEVFARSLKDAEQRTMANCFRVVNQAFRWRMDPFSIVDKTYSVGDGKLAYEGQLVAAVLNTRAGLKGRLRYDYAGKEKTDDRTITVSGTFLDEDEPRTVDLRVGDAKTNNEIWKKDPDQKLVYSGVIKWARRYCPELMLGVLTEDDLERMQARVIETRPVERATAEMAAAVAENANSTPISLPPRQEDPPPSPEAPARLSADDIKSLKGVAKANALTWEDVEEMYDGPLEALEGETADALKKDVLAAIRAKRAMLDAEAKGEAGTLPGMGR